MVDIFRASEHVLPIVQEALAMMPRPRVIWMHLPCATTQRQSLPKTPGSRS